MTPISAVIITYNEERNIGRCIDSLRQVADEIIVVDSFSTDKTEEISVSKGAEFYWNAFEGFAEQKNWANNKAQFDFILSMDADEVLSDKLRSSLLAAKSNLKADVYEMDRLTNFCGKWIKHCGWYPDTKVRLFRKAKAKWEGKKVHEYLTFSAGVKKEKLNGDLLHYSFYSVEQHMATENKYSTLKAEVMKEKGRNPGLLPVIFAPIAKFLKIYIFKLGFLEGFTGFVIAKNAAHGDFLKFSKLWYFNNQKAQDRD